MYNDGLQIYQVEDDDVSTNTVAYGDVASVLWVRHILNEFCMPTACFLERETNKSRLNIWHFL